MNTRPSHKELTGKIRKAREILSSSGYYPVDVEKLASDFRELDLYSPEDQYEALAAALHEVLAKNYKGKCPPERAFERVVADEEFFTFIWESAFLKKKMYLKFCFHESDDLTGEDLFVFSLHEDRPHRKKGRK